MSSPQSSQSSQELKDEISTKGLELAPLVIEDGQVDQYFAMKEKNNDDLFIDNVVINNNNNVNDNGDEGHRRHNESHHGEFGVGNSNQLQVALNIFISFVGSGMLGMPYAFKQSGWLLGIITLTVMSTLNVYAMLLLVQTRKKLEKDGHTGMHGYGDIGRIISGQRGENFVNLCLVISQVGFATAYIIFIAANLYNIAGIHRAYTCFGCVPILAVMVQIQNMKYLSPFSLIADVSNLLGLTAVMIQDYSSYKLDHEDVVAWNFANVLFIASVSLYSLEGVGMVLPLESSCADRKWFPWLLIKTIFGVTTLMAVFGCFGYFAFGEQTLAPITLNLDGGWAIVVKLALCLGLYLTFPIMMFPINEVMEDFVLPPGPRPNRPFRSSVVILSVLLAYAVPDFGKVRPISCFKVVIDFSIFCLSTLKLTLHHTVV